MAPDEDRELHWLTIGDLSRSYRDRSLSPVEVTRALLERIERLDVRLHAYFTVTRDAALAAAASAERELGAGKDRGPLHGVPIGIKDLIATKGVATSAGTAIFRDDVPDEDACVVERLRGAGAVILGKLAMTEGAYAAHHPSFAIPVNPWNAGRWTGVSSSGSGVATAAGLCFGSLGSDTGGSIRFPSAANGIVGLKPTWGRVPRHGVFPLAPSLDHIGPMTRSVVDAALVLRVIAGHDPRDPTSVRASVPDYASGLDRGIEGTRIGLDEAYVGEGMDPAIVSTVLGCAASLRDAGARVRPVKIPPWRDLVRAWPAVCAAEAAVAHERWFPSRADEYGPELRAFLEAGRSAPATTYAKAHEERLVFEARLAELFDEIDLILCPSLGVQLPPANPPIADDPEALETVLRFTAPYDFSGSPTLSLPCGFSADGLPVSLQLVGRHLGEEALLRAGRALERATKWHRRHPAL